MANTYTSDGVECTTEDVCGVPRKPTRSLLDFFFTPKRDLEADALILNRVQLVGPVPNTPPPRTGTELLFNKPTPTLIYVVRRLGCPFCRAPILKMMQSHRRKLEKKNVNIIMITSQPNCWEEFLYTSGFEDFCNVTILLDEGETLKKELFNARKWKAWWLLKPTVLAALVGGLGVKGDSGDITSKTDYLGGEIVIQGDKVVFVRPESSDFAHAKVSILMKHLAL